MGENVAPTDIEEAMRVGVDRSKYPGKFVELGSDPPKGVLLYGPPGTGKTRCARAVANRTDATFIRVIGSELVQRYVGEGARMGMLSFSDIFD